jgi:hypothetical protein
MPAVRTAANPDTPKVRKPPGPRVPVQWGLRPVQSFPESTNTARGEVHDLIKQVQNDASQVGVPFELGTYAASDRAKDSAGNKVAALRKQYKGSGWKFTVADSQLEPGRVAIIGQYKDKPVANGAAGE